MWRPQHHARPRPAHLGTITPRATRCNPPLCNRTRPRSRSIGAEPVSACADIRIRRARASRRNGRRNWRKCRRSRLGRLRSVGRDAARIACLLCACATRLPPACTSERHHRQDGDQTDNATHDMTSSIQRPCFDIRRFEIVATRANRPPLTSLSDRSPPNSPRSRTFSDGEVQFAHAPTRVDGIPSRLATCLLIGCDPLDIPGSLRQGSPLLSQVHSATRAVWDSVSTISCGSVWLRSVWPGSSGRQRRLPEHSDQDE